MPPQLAAGGGMPRPRKLTARRRSGSRRPPGTSRSPRPCRSCSGRCGAARSAPAPPPITLHGLDVLAGAQRQRLAAHEPRRHEPGDHAPSTKISIHTLGVGHRRQEQQQEQRRDGQERVDDAHHEPVDACRRRSPRSRPRASPKIDGQHGRAERRPRATSARRPSAGRARRSRPGRCPAGGRRLGVLVRVQDVRVDLVGVVDVRPDEAEQDDQHDHPEADRREPVLGEDAQRLAQRGLPGRPSCRAPLRARGSTRTGAVLTARVYLTRGSRTP